jgi:8-oxo-dGTP diphosphatase
MWDFPGGGKENGEVPMDCVTREVREEFSIDLDPASVIWRKEYPSMSQPTKIGYFMVAKVSKDQFDGIFFGDEGQRWQLMSVDEFLSRDDVVPHLKGRLRDYLISQK